MQKKGKRKAKEIAVNNRHRINKVILTSYKEAMQFPFCSNTHTRSFQYR